VEFQAGGTDFSDCVSVFRRGVKRPLLRRTRMVRNGRFLDQPQQRPAGEITGVYRSS
jgi:hypothetical protein